MRLIREEKTFIREAVLLMLPMILQNFVTFSMSMADTFMVGVLGETALAAVTMANSPFYVMQLMIFGVQSGMSVLVAQYHGRGDQEAINRVMGIALFVSTTITGLLAITAFCIPKQIMRVLTNNADLVAPGAAYTRYVGFSYFFSAISGVYIAAQCCEHLNRGIVVEKAVLKELGLTQVRAIPQPKAGGSVPAAAWKKMEKPALAVSIQADAAIDIGDTLVGMHIRPVAVPLRISTSHVGHANLVMAYSRLPYIGGARAVYTE